MWGEEDRFQPITYAERFTTDFPHSTLVRIAGPGHIPMENDGTAVARALACFFIA